jgi:hypothetical protein
VTLTLVRRRASPETIAESWSAHGHWRQAELQLPAATTNPKSTHHAKKAERCFGESSSAFSSTSRICCRRSEVTEFRSLSTTFAVGHRGGSKFSISQTSDFSSLTLAKICLPSGLTLAPSESSTGPGKVASKTAFSRAATGILIISFATEFRSRRIATVGTVASQGRVREVTISQLK